MEIIDKYATSGAVHHDNVVIWAIFSVLLFLLAVAFIMAFALRLRLLTSINRTDETDDSGMKKNRKMMIIDIVTMSILSAVYLFSVMVCIGEGTLDGIDNAVVVVINEATEDASGD